MNRRRGEKVSAYDKVAWGLNQTLTSALLVKLAIAVEKRAGGEAVLTQQVELQKELVVYRVNTEASWHEGNINRMKVGGKPREDLIELWTEGGILRENAIERWEEGGTLRENEIERLKVGGKPREDLIELWEEGGKHRENLIELWKVGGTLRENSKKRERNSKDWVRTKVARRQNVLIDFRSPAEKVAADGKIQDLIRLEDLPSEGRPLIAKKAFAYEIRRWLSSYKDFEGLARMPKAPTHLGRRSVEDLLDARKRFNREVVDEKKWLKYTGLKNRSALLRKGSQLVDADWKKAVKQAAKELRAQDT
jgi:hypothetical protein